jgi:DNA replication protein DnaC
MADARFLVFCGKSGVGKSFGAACAVREYLKSRIANWIDRRTWEAAERAADSAMWSDAKEITDDKAAFSRARTAFLLVLDDLGKEEDTQTGRAAVCSVISKRYDAMLATVITTELPMSDIRIRYGSYLAERLAEDAGNGGNIVDCGEVSMRLPCD